MLAAFLARFGINFSIKTLVYVLAILAVVLSIFAFYRHSENTRAALVTQAQKAATAQAVANVELQSQAIEKQQIEVQGRSMEQLSKDRADAEAKWNELSVSLDQIPQTQETKDDQSKPKDAGVQIADPALDALNRAADDAYGLLERASDTQSHSRGR